MENNQKEELVQILGNEIRERFPKVKSINVRIVEVRGKFRSLIEVRFYRKRVFVKKIEDSLNLSLSRAKKALFRQCERHEAKKLRYRFSV